MTIYERNDDDDISMKLLEQDHNVVVWDENHSGGGGGGVKVKEQIVLSEYTTKVRCSPISILCVGKFDEFDSTPSPTHERTACPLWIYLGGNACVDERERVR